MQEKINFNIVENPSKFNEETYSQFLKDYKETKLSAKQLMEKYNFSQLDYKRYLKVIKERTGFKRNKGVQNPRHTYKIPNGTYKVTKTIDGKTYHYGIYKKEEEAIKVRDKLIECNWDINMLDLIKREVLG